MSSFSFQSASVVTTTATTTTEATKARLAVSDIGATAACSHFAQTSNARIARSGRADLAFAPVGQIVGRMNEVRSVRDVMFQLVEEYIETVERLDAGVQA